MDEKKVHFYVSKYLVSSLGGSYPSNFLMKFRDDDTGIEGYTAIDTMNSKLFVLVFKASNEDIDWPTNFNFFQTGSLLYKMLSKKKYPYGDKKSTKVRMHGKYADGYLAVRDSIQNAFKASGCEEIIVVGYSMGFGLTQIGALDLQYNNNLSPDKIGCGGSGPKVFNKAGSVSFNRRVPLTIRYKFGYDIVCKVPPFFYNVGKYFHVGSKKDAWWKMSVKDHAEFRKIALFAEEKSKV